VIKAVTAAATAAVTLPLLIILLATASPAPPAATVPATGLAVAKGTGEPASTVAAIAIAFAEAQLGKPYQWGAAGPDAYDCSGLVYAAYAAAGIRLGRTTYQWRQDGPVVPLSQIQSGDLLFSAGSDGTPANPGHVVMYLGDGQVIQAPQTGQDVQIDPADLASVIVATRPAGLAAKP
jgi:cell wall-associated NlpC family hydrolase